MTDELDWYLSRTGTRVAAVARPDLSAVARAVAWYAYDPDQPREAARVIAGMARDTVATALTLALLDNPLLLSPRKRERQVWLDAAADTRLTALARKRIRELYPEIERAERAAELSWFDREHPAVREILSGRYEGSGAGRPRVPAHYPLMLEQVMKGLRAVSKAASGSTHSELIHLGEEAMDCHRLCREVFETCERVRSRAQELCKSLREQERTDRLVATPEWQAERVEASLADGCLPYANSEILPVGSYGAMEPSWHLEPPVLQFALENQADYAEIDRYGRIAMDWAARIASQGRDLLPPCAPDADGANGEFQVTGGEDTSA